MNSWNNYKSSYTEYSFWVWSHNHLLDLSNKIQQEQKNRKINNDIDIKFYLDAVDNVIAEYTQDKPEEENEISDTAAENIKYFIELLFANYINDYKIVPSPIGAIYCEWRFNKTSMGVGFLDDSICFEYCSLNDNGKEEFFKCKVKSLISLLNVLNRVKSILNAER